MINISTGTNSQQGIEGNSNSLVMIEDDGDEALYLDTAADHYVFTNGNGDQIGIYNGSTPIGPNSYTHNDGWSARHIAANDAGGYTVLWNAGDGTWSLWQLNADGVRVSDQVLGDQSALAPFEEQFQTELDGVLQNLTLIEDDGDEALYLDTAADHYVFTNGNADQIGIYNGSTPIGPNSYTHNDGWSARHIAANDAGGYTVLWNAGDDTWSLWQLNADGVRVSDQVLGDQSALAPFEEQFQTELDGVLQNLTLIEDDGDEALYLDTAADHYVFTNGNGDQIGIYNGSTPIGPNSYTHNDGWSARHIAANDAGGYTVLWNAGDGTWSLWQLNADGVRVSDQVLGDQSALAPFEEQFQTELDGVLQNLTLIEDDGDEALYLDTAADHYVFTNGNADQIGIYNGSTPIGPNSYTHNDGWSARHIAANDAGGYTVLWNAGDDTWSLWQLNADGVRVSDQVLGDQSALAPFEEQFQTELDGVLQNLTLIEDDGDEALYLDTAADHYVFTNGNGDQIGIYNGSTPIGPNSYTHNDGWSARHIAANDAGGYTVLWNAGDGTWSLWQLNADGVRVSDQVLGDQSALAPFEEQFQTELDGVLQNLTLIEDDGDEALYLDTAADHYVFTNGNADQIGIYNGSTPIGPNSYTHNDGWSARHIAANDAGGYTVLWNAGDDTWSLWQLNADGVRVSDQVLGDQSALAPFEEQFQTELDGVLQNLTLIEDDGDEALYLDTAADHYVFTNGNGDQIGIYNGSTPIGPNSYTHNDGWSARHIAANDAGGYTVLWNAGDGTWSLWQLNADGVRVSDQVLGDQSALAPFEEQFQTELDGVLQNLTLIEDDGDEALYLDTAADHYVFTNGNADQIGIYNGSTPIGPNSYTHNDGWSARHIAANDAGGYTVLWNAGDDTWSLWQLNADGVRVSDQVLGDQSALAPFEEQFQTELDGVLQNLTLIEDDGDEALYLDTAADHYVFTNGNADQIGIYNGSTPIGPNSYTHNDGWSARHIAANDAGGYTVLWNAGDDTWSLWQLNADGVRVSDQVLGDQSALAPFEEQFQTELDGDGLLI
ncbi:hypothetical protein K4F85_12025 [Phaeobacter inhibens]|uniref:hypothetical protein n=1 Tax=Phaeobacter inhibens TaxID=221822 RepID=UPI0021A8056B|nr:hypothetical protein [Phaeobacter inhibens]UWR40171.1 hypothetical protein K4F85_12025 [Phaeobacter inhibens]